MSEYKIKSVIVGGVKEWNGPNGIVYYIDVILEGHDKTVSIGKKSPDALKGGDTVYGDIIPTDYTSDKFKPSPPPKNESKWQPKDERQVTKNMVWKNLLTYFDLPNMMPDSEQWDTFWGMVELHTEMLLPDSQKPVTEPPKQPEAKPEDSPLRRGLAKHEQAKQVKKVMGDIEPVPELPEDWGSYDSE